jgi:aconitate decarboxylase
LVRLEVFFKDGTVQRESVEAPRGSEERFASKQDVIEKFDKPAGHAFPAVKVASIRDAVLNLEKLPDAVRLAQVLAKT